MAIMKISIALISLIAIILGYLYFFTGYKSAFEADQQCHYELLLKSDELEGLECDHDLETNQWLLYQKGINNLPSQVIERYRYWFITLLFIIGNKYVAAIDEIIAVIIKVKNCPKEPGRYVFWRK